MTPPTPDSENLTRSNDLKLVLLLVVGLALGASQFFPSKAKSPLAKQSAATAQAAPAANR